MNRHLCLLAYILFSLGSNSADERSIRSLLPNEATYETALRLLEKGVNNSEAETVKLAIRRITQLAEGAEDRLIKAHLQGVLCYGHGVLFELQGTKADVRTASNYCRSSINGKSPVGYLMFASLRLHGLFEGRPDFSDCIFAARAAVANNLAGSHSLLESILEHNSNYHDSPQATRYSGLSSVVKSYIDYKAEKANYNRESIQSQLNFNAIQQTNQSLQQQNQLIMQQNQINQERNRQLQLLNRQIKYGF